MQSELPWETIYAAFEGFAHERYWRDYRLQIVPRDMRFTADVFIMALRAAAEGNPLAVRHLSTLRRFVASYSRIASHYVEVVDLVRAETNQSLCTEDLDAMIAGIRGQGSVSA